MIRVVDRDKEQWKCNEWLCHIKCKKRYQPQGKINN